MHVHLNMFRIGIYDIYMFMYSFSTLQACMRNYITRDK